MPGPGTVKHYDLCMEWDTYLHYPIKVWNGMFFPYYISMEYLS